MSEYTRALLVAHQLIPSLALAIQHPHPRRAAAPHRLSPLNPSAISSSSSESSEPSSPETSPTTRTLALPPFPRSKRPAFPSSRPLRPFASINTPPATKAAKKTKIIEPPSGSSGAGFFVLGLTQTELARRD
ncbi:hypothetical protein BOTBODRAFT_176207 [Botryobasidium botryosum FD-172 SS1]|uniref:Uncharacterized protein n=1 Tax=Botryobasidium botryosum (strain FD-172 SS1) TaxID=930990 RepID=A0A067MLP9_BOTB1|nr:hypothetical protein BOTBODRAFT_176207 [Botryobasidium botryosum FD-172 SS1]